MSYSSEVLADSPLGYWTLGDSLVSPTGLLASSAAVAEANAFDGDPTRQWSAASSVTAATFRVQFPSSTVLTKYAIRRFDLASTRDPKDWTFEGSNNGTSWTTLDTRTGITWPTAGQTQTFTFSNSTAYTYYRLNISAVQTGGDRANLADFTLVFVGDSSGNSRDVGAFGGLTFGATGPVTGATACTFDGSTGYLYKTPESWMNVSAITVEAWVKTSNTSSIMPIIVRDLDPTRSFQFRINAGKLEYLTIGGAAGAVTAQYATSIANGTWRHVAATYDASNIKLYVDGALVVTQAASGALPNDTASSLLIGCHNRSSPLLFAGSIGHVAYYGSALSGARITAHYSAASSGVTGDVSATASAPTLSVAGLVTRTGQVDATAPSPTLAVTGNVAGVTSGAVSATASAPTLAVTGAVIAPITGAVSATAPAPIVNVNDAPTSNLAFDFSAKPDLTVAPAKITLGFLSFDFKTKANLTLGTPLTVTTMALDFAAKPDLNAAFARRHTVDPVTGLPQYRLVAVQADGTRLAELPRAAIGDLTEEIGLDGTKLDFTLPKYDATNAFVLPARGEQIREVQVWRGPNLETWQRVDGARPDAQTIDYDCSGLGGYLDDRMIGKFPKTDLLVNGSFTQGDYGWSYTNEPTSVPASPPNHSIVTVDFFGTKAKALQLTGADKIETHTQSLETAAVFVPNSASFLAGGAAKITAEAHDIPAGTTSILIEGHTAYAYIDGDYGDGLALSLARANAAKPLVQAVHPTATITTVGRGRFRPVASNDTHAGQAKNRRVEFHYTTTVTAAASSAQYAKGSLTSGTITVPTSTKRPVPVTFKGWANLTSYLAASQHGYGVYLQIVKQSAPTVVVDSAYSQLDETTPVGVWERHEATVTVPADGQTYLFDVRFYAPGGVVQWTQGGVYPEEALHFPDDDQALIAKGIIEHVQDPAMGKLGDTPILIGTRTPLTGTKRIKTYPYHERRTASDALGELGSMHGGMDMRVGFDETTRWVETHYPRLGNTVPVTLALGSNVIAYDAPTDATAAGTRWIAQALESSGADREEGMAEDLSGLGGMLVERLAYSEPGTAVTELTQTAVSSLKRNGHPIAALEVTIGLVTGSIAAQVELTNFMLDRVKVGDVVGVEIIDGPIVIVGPHRVIRRRLTPATDQLRYSLAPEV